MDAHAPHLTEIWIYPIKSAAGVPLTEAAVEAGGLRHDRRWMVVDASGTFLSQRTHPALARVGTWIEPEALRVTAPGFAPLRVPLAPPPTATRRVRVWDDLCDAISAGAEARAWISAVMGLECDLVYVPETALRTVDRRYASGGERVGFADAFPFLLTSTASLAALNARLAAPVPMARFRPNLVLTGCAPFAEDELRRFRLGAVTFRAAKACSRCVLINVDQTSGTRGTEPLAALARFRARDNKVLFGQNLVHEGPGTLHVGDRLERLDEETST